MSLNDQDIHLHWRIKGTNTGEIDPIEVTVAGYFTEEEAIEAVRGLINRDRYVVTQVWECSQCKYQDGILKQQKESLEYSKEHTSSILKLFRKMFV